MRNSVPFPSKRSKISLKHYINICGVVNEVTKSSQAFIMDLEEGTCFLFAGNSLFRNRPS